MKAEILVDYFQGLPPELVVLIIGMTPVFELRGAIPVAIGLYEMSPVAAYFWSVIGNIIPTIFLVFLLDTVSTWLSARFDFWKRFFNWLFERTRRRAQDKIEKYGPWGLYFLVAIPLPMTGGWTGALAAFLFGVRRRQSIPVIALGILTAGVVVMLLSLGIF